MLPGAGPHDRVEAGNGAEARPRQDKLPHSTIPATCGAGRGGEIGRGGGGSRVEEVLLAGQR